MKEFIFSIRRIVNGGCSGVCLMQVEARTRSDATRAAISKARKMGMRNFCVSEVC